MSKFHLREVAKCTVTQRLGYVHGIHQVSGDETKCDFLHLDDEGNRVIDYGMPESHLNQVEPGIVPSFPDPYSTTNAGY